MDCDSIKTDIYQINIKALKCVNHNLHALHIFGRWELWEGQGTWCLIEPRHDKTNKMGVRQAKTQISLGICPVWSELSLYDHWVAKDPSFLHADSEDYD